MLKKSLNDIQFFAACLRDNANLFLLVIVQAQMYCMEYGIQGVCLHQRGSTKPKLPPLMYHEIRREEKKRNTNPIRIDPQAKLMI